MKSSWALILITLIAATPCAGAGEPPSLMEIAIAKMAATKGPFVVVLGDSIAQGAVLPETVCGLPLINAGVSGSRAATFIPFAAEMAAMRFHPALIVVALGVNDAQIGVGGDFGTEYRLLINTLPGSPMALATPAPINSSLPEARRRDPAAVQSIRGLIMSIAAEHHATAIDINALANFETSDGVHPTAGAYPRWVAAAIGGIERALRCKNAPASSG